MVALEDIHAKYLEAKLIHEQNKNDESAKNALDEQAKFEPYYHIYQAKAEILKQNESIFNVEIFDLSMQRYFEKLFKAAYEACKTLSAMDVLPVNVDFDLNAYQTFFGQLEGMYAKRPGANRMYFLDDKQRKKADTFNTALRETFRQDNTADEIQQISPLA